ncbi:MAG TPA: hypothetical protein VGF16_01815 [Bryobacteraceae bacterium]|jgi:DNA-binding response OmpR family regulator
MIEQGRSALLVSLYPDDRLILTNIFEQQNWSLTAVGSLRSALAFLRRRPVPLVIAERDFRGGGWKDVLAAVRDLPNAPALVVISRLADEHLWSEVLNLGGHDVLAKPLRQAEVLWVFRHVLEKYAGLPRRAAGAETVHSSGALARAAGC